uniref:Uncharacterized protein n=1 Tax=Molossus molossus TaxID=27622 RepID=A0A7J8JVW8_MOLMO|nr:hypothetical protein HJG59_008004 [Molossus molossus]
MCWQRNNPSNTMNNQAKLGAQKENGKSPEIKFKVMENSDLPDREFKIAIMKILNNIQENSERKFVSSEIKSINKRNTLPKRPKLKRNQTEILKLKHSIKMMRNALESTGNRANQMEERISKLED